MAERVRTVLLVEDSLADGRIAQRAARKHGGSEMQIVTDGETGLARIMSGTASEPGAERLDLVILDLNLPDISGHDVLERARANRIPTPIVVMSSSYSSQEIDRCYRLGCNAYVRKSMDPDEYGAAVEEVLRHWLDIVALPAAASSDA